MYAVGSQFGSGSLFGKDNLMISFHYFYNVLIPEYQQGREQVTKQFLESLFKKQSNIKLLIFKVFKVFHRYKNRLSVKKQFPVHCTGIYILPIHNRRKVFIWPSNINLHQPAENISFPIMPKGCFYDCLSHSDLSEN